MWKLSHLYEVKEVMRKAEDQAFFIAVFTKRDQTPTHNDFLWNQVVQRRKSLVQLYT